MKRTRKLKLPEPKAVREVHRWRERVQKRAEEVGWDEYLQQINSRQSLITEAGPMALKESPKQYRAGKRPQAKKKQP